MTTSARMNPTTGTGATLYPLEAVGLRKVYGHGHTEVVALHHASLAVQDSEFLALVGPSGSGKTTLLSILGALLTPTAGTARIGGRDIVDLSSREQTRFRARRIGFVFQSYNLVPFLTARENLLIAAQFAGLRSGAKTRADELLADLELAPRARNLPGELSGGERQRVAIGRALMNDPDVILVDEPTANLDTKHGEAVVEMLAAEIRKRGKAGIMVTHDLRMVDYTDRTLEINDGVVEG